MISRDTAIGPVLRYGLEETMDELSFDRLARLVSTDASRRKVVKSASASALGMLGLAKLLGVEEAKAKKGGKKKKSRRCKKTVNASCNPPGKKCCRGLACEEGKCCKSLGTKCEDGSECCGNGICDQVEGGNSQTLCCHLAGEPCSKTSDCCETFSCSGGECAS
jgi:hypothetical protein